jgi:hypothetical protein
MRSNSNASSISSRLLRKINTNINNTQSNCFDYFNDEYLISDDDDDQVEDDCLIFDSSSISSKVFNKDILSEKSRNFSQTSQPSSPNQKEAEEKMEKPTLQVHSETIYHENDADDDVLTNSNSNNYLTCFSQNQSSDDSDTTMSEDEENQEEDQDKMCDYEYKRKFNYFNLNRPRQGRFRCYSLNSASFYNNQNVAFFFLNSFMLAEY